ncbi:MAG TPA: pilus assembly protein PilP, partial [Alcanivorax sp.]|nr:pilus assembly protein PilP [Alcanivorax sp.]
ALIEDPTGSVTRVRVGSYMGRNFGRVVEVSSDQIALVEIVPDGQDGWVERSRNISLAE